MDNQIDPANITHEHLNISLPNTLTILQNLLQREKGLPLFTIAATPPKPVHYWERHPTAATQFRTLKFARNPDLEKFPMAVSVPSDCLRLSIRSLDLALFGVTHLAFRCELGSR
jgi:hypothetical protein